MTKQTLKKNKKTIIVAAIVVIFSLFLYYLLDSQEKASEIPVDRLVEFNGSEIEEKRDGKVSWHLTADKIMIDPDSQNMYFEKPKALIYDEDTEFTVTASKGVYDRKKGTVELKTPLKAVTNKGDTLQTKGSVYYNVNTRKIKGGKVTVKRHDKTTLSGDSFETNAALDNVVLTGHAKVEKGE